MEKALQQGVMRQRNEAKTFSMGGNIVTFPPAHIHGAESEATYVLEGELLLTLGERSIKASAGSVLSVPKGTRHGLSNLGPGTARILVILTPPGLEGFWEEMADLLKVSGGKPDPANVLSLQQKYHMDTGGKPRQV